MDRANALDSTASSLARRDGDRFDHA